ncbi:MAG: PQQ-binding-like beta-propeller repeat protein [Planctomycetes bacterium]|nr:PQQ-binding-like beta-propeller repeat protein [Planctomycetota bacterium]
MLKGNLSGFSLGELLQSLAVSRRTGTLKIILPGSETKHLYFEEGDLRFFSHGTPRTPRIGQLLRNSGLLDEDQLKEAVKEAKASGRLLGKVLLEQNVISEDDIRRALQQKISEEVYDLFGLEEGEFEFEPDTCPEEIFDSLQKSVPLRIHTSPLIMEGLRRLDEWTRIRTVIKTENEIFDLGPQGIPPHADALTRAVLSSYDGLTPVGELSRQGNCTRFEFLLTSFEAIHSGRLQLLDPETALREAETARANRHFIQAAALLRHASEQSPGDPAILVQLGDVLGLYYQEGEARKSYLQALELYFEGGDWSSVTQLAEKLPGHTELDLRHLQILLQAYVELRLAKKALWVGNQLASRFQEQGETGEAVSVLHSLQQLDPKDLNLTVQIATLFQQAGETQQATAYYEEVARGLEAKKKVRDQVKILRIIADLNPHRADIKQRIATLVALEERLEKQRKRRITIAGVSIIAILVGSFIPLLYELKARELYSEGRRAKEEAFQTGDYTKAKLLFTRLRNSYGLSSPSRLAACEIEEIQAIERRFIEIAETNLHDADDEQQLRELTERVESLMSRARAAEAEEDFEEAHELIRQVMGVEGAKDLSVVQELKLPLLLATNPPGARLEIDGQYAGKSPHVHRYRPGDSVTVKITHAGCLDLTSRLALTSQIRMEIVLSRRPLAEHVLPASFDQRIQPAGLRRVFVFPSQDGNIYAYDPESQSIVWQQSVGKFGDRISDLNVREGVVYAGTVNNEVQALDVSGGEVRWTARRIRGPFQAAPAVSEDQRLLAVANVFGEVYILDHQSGERYGEFLTENRVAASPVFLEGYLVVGSTDSHVYAYDLASKSIRFIKELSGEIRIDPVVHEGAAFFATGDGCVHRIAVEGEGQSWSTRITDRSIVALKTDTRGILAAVAAGHVMVIDPAIGTVDRQWKIAEAAPGGMLVDGDTLYVGFHDGTLVAWDMSADRRSWSWQADASIDTEPLLLSDRLYVACSSGTVQELEIFR